MEPEGIRVFPWNTWPFYVRIPYSLHVFPRIPTYSHEYAAHGGPFEIRGIRIQHLGVPPTTCIYISCAGYKNLRSPERLLSLEFRTAAGNENLNRSVRPNNSVLRPILDETNLFDENNVNKY